MAPNCHYTDRTLSSGYTHTHTRKHTKGALTTLFHPWELLISGKMDGGSNPRTLSTSPHSITHTLAHTPWFPQVPSCQRYRHCQPRHMPAQPATMATREEQEGTFPYPSPSLHLSGRKRGLLAYMERRIKVAGGALNIAYLPFKLLRPSFSFSFYIFLLLPCLFPLLSRKRMPSLEERGEGSL